MTLALILLSSILGGMSAQSAAATPRAFYPATQAAPAASTQGTDPQTPDQANQSQPSSQKSSKSTVSTQQPSPAKKPGSAKPRRKKRLTSANCNSSPATSTASASASSPSTADPASGGNTPSPTASAPRNCPPSKIIVRQGGTSEPSIQLAGGAVGDQAANQRDSANQMLGSTEANLKKLAGQQLSANQQEMVTQVRQFMEQSRTAVSAGDLERARTLAWKAQLLSEELVKPAK
jgi:hypothetical protein